MEFELAEVRNQRMLEPFGGLLPFGVLGWMLFPLETVRGIGCGFPTACSSKFPLFSFSFALEFPLFPFPAQTAPLLPSLGGFLGFVATTGCHIFVLLSSVLGLVHKSLLLSQMLMAAIKSTLSTRGFLGCWKMRPTWMGFGYGFYKTHQFVHPWDR